MHDIAMMTIEEVSDKIKNKEVSPLDLTKACLSRIDALNPTLNAYVYTAHEQAVASAKNAETEIMRGSYRGRLHGIPIALKDLYYTKNMPTTACSKVLADFRPDYDGTAVKRLVDHGAVILGKTNTTEFAFGPTNEESCFGPARNPHNPQKIPGGSSGGSAVAAASGMAYMAMGSDSGGSIRIPAAMCGCVGFKPSIGLISSYGIVPLSVSMDTPGPLCRSVADAAITLDAVTGTDENDPCPYAIKGRPTRFYESLSNAWDLKGKVLGIPSNFFFDKTDYQVERVFFEAVDRLKMLGAEIREIFIPALDLIPTASTNLMFYEAALAHKEHYPSKKELYSKGVADRIEIGRSISKASYLQAVNDRERMMAIWEDTLQTLDAVLAPTCPIEPFDIGLDDPWLITTRRKTEQGKPMATYHTRLSNMTGAPALSLPAGLTANRLPVGIMIMGKRNDDLGVLKIGRAYERTYTYPTPQFVD